MFPSPSTDLSSTSDVWIRYSRRGSPRIGYPSAVPSIYHQDLSPVFAGSEKCTKPSLPASGVPGGDSSANRFPERRRRLSTRLRAHFKKHRSYSPPTCLSLERLATDSSTSAAAVVTRQVETIERIPIRVYFSCQETRAHCFLAGQERPAACPLTTLTTRS